MCAEILSNLPHKSLQQAEAGITNVTAKQRPLWREDCSASATVIASDQTILQDEG